MKNDEHTEEAHFAEETNHAAESALADKYRHDLYPPQPINDYSTFGFVNRFDENGRSLRGLAL